MRGANGTLGLSSSGSGAHMRKLGSGIRGMTGAELAWKERAIKLPRLERTSLSSTVATTVSTSSSPSNCDPCATSSPLSQIIAQPSK